MSTLKLDGTELHYETYGQGPAIIFIHGGGGSSLMWWRQVPFFAIKYQVIIYDQRGFGRSRNSSEVAKGSAPVLSSDLEALLDHLDVSTALAFVGHSLGTHPALDLAERQPHRTQNLVLSGAYGGLLTTELEAYAQRRHDLLAALQQQSPDGGSARDAISRIHSPFSKQTRELRPDLIFLTARIAELGATPPLQELRGFLATSRRINEDSARHLRARALVIGGTQDLLMPIDELRIAARALNHSHIMEIPNAGHAAFFEQPDEFNRAILRFLEAEGKKHL
jgi:pimeloyl-ACP methyl ester carboxylesterase